MKSETATTQRGFDDFVVTLGDELRGERATRGKSLLDVQRDLRIKAAYIAAIENCDPSVFPNRGFVAGYVRSYARYLNLDADKIFRRFCKESGFKSINADLAAKGTSDVAEPAHEGLTSPFEGLSAPQRDSILNTISPSGVASVMVLVGLIFGIGYGGWTVLQDIQRVEFAPVDQTPGAVADVAVPTAPSAETVPDLVALAKQEAGDSYRETILSQLYRPKELDVPKVEPRDGPIASIDPDSVGNLRPDSLPESLRAASVDLAAAKSEEFQGPIVTLDMSPPPVEVVAIRAAWVRVYEKSGTILMEKILEPGERYRIPADAVQPIMRAGNSGSVYVVVDGNTFGPVGNGTSVAKGVALDLASVNTGFPLVTDVVIPADPSLRSAEASQ